MSQNVAPEKRTLLALALAAGTPIGDAADQAGLHRRTVERWLKKPAFRRRIADLRSQVVAAALGRLTDNLTRAADTVAALLTDEKSHVRLRAARTLMSFNLRFRDAIDVADRIQNLERDLAQRQGVAP